MNLPWFLMKFPFLAILIAPWIPSKSTISAPQIFGAQAQCPFAGAVGPPLLPKQHWEHQGPVDPGDEEQLPSPSLRNEKSTETSETILYIPPWNLGNLRMIMPCCNYTVTLWSGESSMGGCVMPDTSVGCQLRYQSKHTKDLRSKFEPAYIQKQTKLHSKQFHQQGPLVLACANLVFDSTKAKHAPYCLSQNRKSQK